jgi:hypothetical protein
MNDEIDIYKNIYNFLLDNNYTIEEIEIFVSEYNDINDKIELMITLF